MSVTNARPTSAARAATIAALDSVTDVRSLAAPSLVVTPYLVYSNHPEWGVLADFHRGTFVDNHLLGVTGEAKQMLEDLVLAAVIQAQNKARKLYEEEMKKATGGLPMQLPGLF